MTFHPYAQVIRKICTSLAVRSSTFLSKGFNLPRHRSTGFGYPSSDSRRAHLVPHPCGLRTCWFPFGSEFLTLSLATEQNSMARYSKRTIGHWYVLRHHPFHALSKYNRLVSGSFNLPSRVLFSFHSRYYCAIGLETYLELEMNVSLLHARYPTHVTLGTSKIFFSDCSYGTITLYGPAFQQISDCSIKKYPSPQHHISTPFLERIQFALCRFRSPLLTASRLISFPAVTRMFRSTAFPAITGHSEEYEVIFSNHRIIGFLHLPGAYRSLTRPSSALEPSHSPIGVASRSLILSA